MRMPQIMTEAFARGLVDKIMVEVLNVIDRDTQNGKSWEQRVDEEAGDGQSEFVHGRSQPHERAHVTSYSKAEEMELIAKIVRDLRDIKIGDSRYVLPPPLLALEKQVKYAAYNVDDASHANPTDIVETRATQGQGDTHQIVHTAVLEAPAVETESAETVRKEKENEATGEATKVSVGLLHQLIEELENKPISAKNSENIASTSLTSKENIAAWEEKEEQFIRTIENTGSLPETTTDTLRASESAGCFRNVALQPYEEPSGELKSRSSQHVASTSRESCLEEMQIQRYDSSPLSSSMLRRDNAAMEEILTMNEIETRKASGEATMTTTTKKRKKKGLGGRLRKFFRAVFARKN